MEIVTPAVEKMVERGNKLLSDGSTSYNGLKENYDLESKVNYKKEIDVVLPWGHKAIVNANKAIS